MALAASYEPTQKIHVFVYGQYVNTRLNCFRSLASSAAFFRRVTSKVGLMGILNDRLNDRIEKARDRAGGVDMKYLAASLADKAPKDIASPDNLAQRRDFLQDSLGEREASQVFERIINGNELQDVNYLARGSRAAKSICRIVINQSPTRQLGFGTGFLIAPNVLITNNHVLPNKEVAQYSVAQFDFEMDLEGVARRPSVFGLTPAKLYFTSEKLDFSIVHVEPVSRGQGTPLTDFSYLPLLETTGKVVEGEWLTIIQHPNGERKQLCVRENRFIKRTPDAIWYSSDTLAGSSGSAVFNNDWYVVALHHSGIPAERNGHTQTIDGRDFDPNSDDESQIKWIANEGIRVSRIVETLRQALPNEPLLRPIFEATAAQSRVPALPMAPSPLAIPSDPSEEQSPMSSSPAFRQIRVTLNIDADNQVSIASSGAASESAIMASAFEAAQKKAKPPVQPAPFNSDYSDRKGFHDNFLGNSLHVQQPTMNAALQAEAAPLLKPTKDNKHVLNYHNYSVVMHAERRFAIYSAANIDFDNRFKLGRPKDNWRTDPRILAKHQITDFYYEGNRFDRGHLTRYEDLEFGASRQGAMISAADTCHWTNCTPQHDKFNRTREWWQGLEQHLLEESIERKEFKAQVFTGPILREDDPVYKPLPDIQYPVRFWKVAVAATGDGKGLFAAAFLMDQSAVIAKYGLAEAAEAPFETYLYQVPVTEIERLTGLTFTWGAGGKKSLRDVDPLNDATTRARKQRRRRASLMESAGAEPVPDGYIQIDDFSSIVTP